MEDVTATGALVAIIMSLTKIIEWQVKKYQKKNDTSTDTEPSLQPEQGRQLRELHESMITVKRDIDEMKTSNEKHAEVMRDIAQCMMKVAESQAKTASLLEKIDRRMEIEEAIRFHRAAGGEQ